MELPTHKEMRVALVQLRKTRDETTEAITRLETVIGAWYSGDTEPPLVSIGQGDNAQHTHDGELWQGGSGFTATEVDAGGFPATIITRDGAGDARTMLEALETLRNDCEALLDDDEDILGSMSLGQYVHGMLLNTINPAIAKATRKPDARISSNRRTDSDDQGNLNDGEFVFIHD